MKRNLSYLLFAAFVTAVTCDTPKLFYIYEFPAEALDTWPKYGHPLSDISIWNHAFNENEGFGRYDNSTGSFETWEHSSFRLIMSRLLRSKYRTRDISKASLFFVPYDGGSEVYMSRTGELRMYGSPLTDWLVEQLPSYPTMRRYKGLDHVLIHSSGTSNRWINLGSLRHLINFSLNNTFLVPEKFPFHSKGMFSRVRSVQGVPMPAAFHWKPDVGKASIPVTQPFLHKKEIFISLFDTFETFMKESNKIRYVLTDYCDKANAAAQKGDPKYAAVQGEFGSVCRHNPYTTGWKKRHTTPLEEMAMYQKSVYCLCPPGLTPISQCVFNSLLAGCIPVVFRNHQARYPLMQYDWHLSREKINISFVVLDATSHQKIVETNFVDNLVVGYSPRNIRKTLRTTAKLALGLQYSMPPDVRQYGFPSVQEILPTWDPPFTDAVDIILTRLFDEMTKLEPTFQEIAAQVAEEEQELVTGEAVEQSNDKE